MIPVAVTITLVVGLQEANRPQEVALSLDEVIFDSETDLDTPLSIGWLDGALLVDSGRVALVDGSSREIVVVDFEQHAVAASAVTSTSELLSGRLLDRLPSGQIIVADQNHGTITIYGPTLGVLSTATFNPMAGRPIGRYVSRWSGLVPKGSGSINASAC